ncbi:hypothetical protein Tco_0439257 [Tanacetum coccineum]
MLSRVLRNISVTNLPAVGLGWDSGDIRKITDINVNKLHQPWRSFAAIINKYLSGIPSYDSLRLSQAQILWVSRQLCHGNRSFKFRRREKQGQLALCRDDPMISLQSMSDLRNEATQVVRGDLAKPHSLPPRNEILEKENRMTCRIGRISLRLILTEAGAKLKIINRKEAVKKLQLTHASGIMVTYEGIVWLAAQNDEDAGKNDVNETTQDDEDDDDHDDDEKIQDDNEHDIDETRISVEDDSSISSSDEEKYAKICLYYPAELVSIIWLRLQHALIQTKIQVFDDIFGQHTEATSLIDTSCNSAHHGAIIHCSKSIALQHNESVDYNRSLELRQEEINMLKRSPYLHLARSDIQRQSTRQFVEGMKPNQNLVRIQLWRYCHIKSPRGLVQMSSDQEPSAGTVTGVKEARLPSPDHAWNKSVPAVHESVQPWLSNLAQQDPRESFDELTDSTFDFSAFVMNRLNVQTLTPELLAGPTFELMKGTCKSLTELEYFCEEVYKATTEKLDWINPEGRQYPHDLRQPLPLVPNTQGRHVIPFHHFINNDLEYLRGGVSSRKYSTSVTKTTAADYGHIKWIEDLVPNSMWSQMIVKYDKFALWGISHWGKKRRQFYAFATSRESARDVYSKRRIIAVTKVEIVEWQDYKHLDWITVRRDDDVLYKFKEGDFHRLRIQDIEDMLLLLVQGKVTNLNVEERIAFNVSLRSLLKKFNKKRSTSKGILERDLQLGLESNQKKLNRHKA